MRTLLFATSHTHSCKYIIYVYIWNTHKHTDDTHTHSKHTARQCTRHVRRIMYHDFVKESRAPRCAHFGVMLSSTSVLRIFPNRRLRSSFYVFFFLSLLHRRFVCSVCCCGRTRSSRACTVHAYTHDGMPSYYSHTYKHTHK